MGRDVGRLCLLVSCFLAASLLGCAPPRASVGSRAASSPASAVTHRRYFIVVNDGRRPLGGLRLARLGGPASEIATLYPGQQLAVSVEASGLGGDTVLIDTTLHVAVGVEGPTAGSDATSTAPTQKLAAHLYGTTIDGWVSPIGWPKDVPGGAGYPTYRLSAAKRREALAIP